MQRRLFKEVDKNLKLIEDLFKDCYDIVIRIVEIGNKKKIKIGIIFIDGLIDKNHISEYTLGQLVTEDEIDNLEDINGDKLYEIISKKIIANAEIKKESNMENMVNSILSGDTVLLMDMTDSGIIIGSKGWQSRGINEPQTETVIRGPRDGFTESLKINTSLVRRRIKDTNLKIVTKSVGRRSQTGLAILYMDDIANKDILKSLYKRIEAIDIDAILDSSILENLIEDNYLSAFPQIENTERPDSVAASLYEGRIAIVVDNSPFALIIPATLGTLFQSSEDYYTRWTEASFVRLIRFIAIFLSVMSPALYIAITAYHPGLLPTKLTYFLATSRKNVPFPAVVEALLMELTLELLRESGTRISGPIGTTIGIVGGLIIGQAAVDAGIVSPLMIIIVAITTIASFSIPSYEFAAGFRVWRFILIGFSAILGLYGIMLGVIILAVHLVKLESFGVPFTSPYSGLGVDTGELRDTLIKAPVQYMSKRPAFTSPRNKIRMRSYWRNYDRQKHIK